MINKECLSNRTDNSFSPEMTKQQNLGMGEPIGLHTIFNLWNSYYFGWRDYGFKIVHKLEFIIILNLLTIGQFGKIFPISSF